MRPIVVCVTGLDGAGKSTEVDSLAARLEEDGRSVAVSAIWDAILGPDFEGHRLFTSGEEAYAYLEMLSPVARLLFLGHGLSESLTRCLARDPEIVILNAYWYKYYATEVAHGGDAGALRAVMSGLPEPDVTFYLRISIAEAARRKGTFSPYETGFHPERSAEAFEAFQVPALGELEGLAEELGWVVLPNEGPEATGWTDRIVGHLEKLAPAAFAAGGS